MDAGAELSWLEQTVLSLGREREREREVNEQDGELVQPAAGVWLCRPVPVDGSWLMLFWKILCFISTWIWFLSQTEHVASFTDGVLTVKQSMVVVETISNLFLFEINKFNMKNNIMYLYFSVFIIIDLFLPFIVS